MSVLIGKKVGMTQVYTDKGDCVPVTVIQVERCVPVLKRTQEDDGYQALMLAYGSRKPKHTNKPLKGFYDKHNVEPARLLKEFRGQDVDDDALGKPLKVDVFNEGDRVQVVGASKGRGFAGVFKRFNYGGAPASHGHHESYRGTGSIGMHTYPGRVLKGTGMPGRMGGNQVHTKNLQVVRVDAENNVLLLKGAVPGANGGIVSIFKS
ncbi:MAG: 50S ribosomal protein L3 [Nitrospina sp.]|jgi:large subunit ribosomal protein L3|nr:50S ribosomal protein L3 [Nitrospina sp.]MBT3510942.1 50S ribosomal protein L3 [Nitrospina sp.]MBT3875055.1 50S ribosomal protein L3 [Nitrospina sp.]MBT4047366.1 50S ribosomal protein L3 [Nitrospina sp.]MBT4558450.1 50S ribosomal protein L3 [Nitrospina sp.]